MGAKKKEPIVKLGWNQYIAISPSGEKVVCTEGFILEAIPLKEYIKLKKENK